MAYAGVSKSDEFQSTPSVWRVTKDMTQQDYIIRFQSTPSVWRVTMQGVDFSQKKEISIHTLRVEGD